MLHKTRNLTCLIFANGVSHFSKRYKISPNWHGSISNDPSGTEETGSPSQERDALSACSPIGKAHPTLSANSGTCFPLAAQRENTSHSEPRFWDVLSATPPSGKLHPILKANSGTRFPPEASTGPPCPIPKPNSGTHFPKHRPSGKPVPLWAHWSLKLSAY